MRTTLSIVVAALLVVASGSRAADQETENYVASLSRVYDHTLWIRAVKEGCDSEDKKTAGANSVAYNSWRRRNSALLDELERRFLVLVHGASTDQKDYTKNVGKYMGEVVQHREDIKRNFLGGPAEDVQRQCKGFAEALRGDEGNLEKRYAEELKTIRKRKM